MEAYCAPTCGARTRPRGARSRWWRRPGRGGRCRQAPAQYIWAGASLLCSKRKGRCHPSPQPTSVCSLASTQETLLQAHLGVRGAHAGGARSPSSHRGGGLQLLPALLVAGGGGGLGLEAVGEGEWKGGCEGRQTGVALVVMTRDAGRTLDYGRPSAMAWHQTWVAGHGPPNAIPNAEPTPVVPMPAVPAPRAPPSTRMEIQISPARKGRQRGEAFSWSEEGRETA